MTKDILDETVLASASVLTLLHKIYTIAEISVCIASLASSNSLVGKLRDVSCCATDIFAVVLRFFTHESAFFVQAGNPVTFIELNHFTDAAIQKIHYWRNGRVLRCRLRNYVRQNDSHYINYFCGRQFQVNDAVDNFFVASDILSCDLPRSFSLPFL